MAERTNLLDSNDLLRVVMHALVNSTEATCAELLKDGVLTGGVSGRDHRNDRRRRAVARYFVFEDVWCLRGVGGRGRRASEDAWLRREAVRTVSPRVPLSVTELVPNRITKEIL